MARGSYEGNKGDNSAVCTVLFGTAGYVVIGMAIANNINALPQIPTATISALPRVTSTTSVPQSSGPNINFAANEPRYASRTPLASSNNHMFTGSLLLHGLSTMGPRGFPNF